MNGEGGTITFRRRRGWTAVPNSAVSDQRLSIEARGLLAYLASHADGYQFRVEAIRRNCGVGREKLQRMLGELKRAKYLKTTPVQGERGRLLGWKWELDLDADVDNCADPAGDRVTEKPSDGGPAPIRTTRSKNNNTPLNAPQPSTSVDNSACGEGAASTGKRAASGGRGKALRGAEVEPQARGDRHRGAPTAERWEVP